MVNQLLKTALGRLRIVAFIEGCSFLLLGFTMILKYKFSIPQPNYIVGLAHGARCCCLQQVRRVGGRQDAMAAGVRQIFHYATATVRGEDPA
ncbi:MAG: DUF3817 domain-containing protein, partial [Bacteroidota bacterium]